MLLPWVQRAKSMTVVVPPCSAARLTTAGGSVRPTVPSGFGRNQLQCTCGSMPPGMTILPVASMRRVPITDRKRSRRGYGHDAFASDGDVAGANALGRDDPVAANEEIDHRRPAHSKIATARIGLAVPPRTRKGKPTKRKPPRPTS